MNNLIIEKTQSTPLIKFDAGNHRLAVRGESFPENAANFYAPVIDWLKAYIAEVEEQKVSVDFEIIYFNTSTSKVFMMFFDMLDKGVADDKHFCVNWICNEQNETAIECGEEFKEDLTQLPFHIVIVKGV